MSAGILTKSGQVVLLVAATVSAVSCGAGPVEPERGESVSEQTQAIVSAGCADGSAEQVFAGGIVGCAGAVIFPKRDDLCGPGYHPLNAMTWQTSRGPTIPTHHYWTNNVLNYQGSGTGMCSAQYSTGTACPADQPMRVCASTFTDPEGNNCNWFNCAFDTSSTTPNDYFGGCAGNTTAGTLCVPDSGCADGTVEQTFTRGMVGCAGAVTVANAATLCTAGFALADTSDFPRYRNGVAPTHNYWTGNPPLHYSGSSLSCTATFNATDPSCPASTPMRVCVPGGTDPEGNRCNWSNCDVQSSYSTTTNEYFGGCLTNSTAGALCVPYRGCADGTIDQQWNKFYIGCAGSVGWGNRESLCGPRQLAVPSNLWPGLHHGVAPSHNYWTNGALRYSGKGSGNCSVSETVGTSCGMDNPMHICTPSGVDPEGNHCNWTHCGMNATTPDSFLGGCGATAGTVCMTGP